MHKVFSWVTDTHTYFGPTLMGGWGNPPVNQMKSLWCLMVVSWVVPPVKIPCGFMSLVETATAFILHINFFNLQHQRLEVGERERALHFSSFTPPISEVKGLCDPPKCFSFALPVVCPSVTLLGLKPLPPITLQFTAAPVCDPCLPPAIFPCLGIFHAPEDADCGSWTLMPQYIH